MVLGSKQSIHKAYCIDFLFTAQLHDEPVMMLCIMVVCIMVDSSVAIVQTDKTEQLGRLENDFICQIHQIFIIPYMVKSTEVRTTDKHF